MFLFNVVLLSFSVLSGLAQIPGPPLIPRSQTYQGRDTDGTYSFGYTVHEPTGTTKFRQESGDGAGNRLGSYGLEEKNSQRIVFNYATKPRSANAQTINHGPDERTPPHRPSSEDHTFDSADFAFGSNEPRSHEMEEERPPPPSSYDDDYDYEGGRKFPVHKIRQASNTHWNGGQWSKHGGDSEGSGPPSSGPRDEYPMGENSDGPNDSYDRLVDYLAGQNNRPSHDGPSRESSRPDDFSFKSR